MTTLNLIERNTNRYANAHDLLSHAISEMNTELVAVKNKHLQGIKLWVRKTKTAEAKLEALINDNPDLFTKPKTLIISGVKVGYQKDRDQLLVTDIDKTVALIKKHMPKQKNVLINVKTTLVNKALGNLDEKQLKQIGIVLVPGMDQIVIKSTDSEVDKLVNALLKETDKEV